MKKETRRKVQKIIDGDTFRVRQNVNGSNYIRIAGVNAPEKGERGYSAAKRKLQKQIGNSRVTIRPKGRSYGRVVAEVPAVKRRKGLANASKSTRRRVATMGGRAARKRRR